MALTNDDLLAISQLLEVKLKAEIQPIKNEMQTLKNEIHKINLFQENVLLPRLDTIKSCYLSTYNRYKDCFTFPEVTQAHSAITSTAFPWLS
ncbi:MAG TPA: hypothetical protein DCZ91_18800 [Lachnospiraceae bacterium]|nr:hypothetical protein [Lachnospiraceae bacterium]